MRQKKSLHVKTAKFSVLRNYICAIIVTNCDTIFINTKNIIYERRQMKHFERDCPIYCCVNRYLHFLNFESYALRQCHIVVVLFFAAMCAYGN